MCLKNIITGYEAENGGEETSKKVRRFLVFVTRVFVKSAGDVLCFGLIVSVYSLAGRFKRDIGVPGLQDSKDNSLIVPSHDKDSVLIYGISSYLTTDIRFSTLAANAVGLKNT